MTDQPDEAGRRAASAEPPEPAEPAATGGPAPAARRPAGAGRKQVLLRLDPAVHDALAGWAAGELRSTNAQIEFLLRRALADAGRLPAAARPIPRRGRPPKSATPEEPSQGPSETS